MIRRVRRERSGPAKAYLASAIALLALVGQLSTAVHLALFRHVVCLQHGELIHLDESEAGTPALAETPPHRGPPERVSFQSRTQSVDDDRHDHCFLAAHRREIAAASRARIAAAKLPPVLRGARIPKDVRRPAPVALFLIAPKNSPPSHS